MFNGIKVCLLRTGWARCQKNIVEVSKLPVRSPIYIERYTHNCIRKPLLPLGIHKSGKNQVRVDVLSSHQLLVVLYLSETATPKLKGRSLRDGRFAPRP